MELSTAVCTHENQLVDRHAHLLKQIDIVLNNLTTI